MIKQDIYVGIKLVWDSKNMLIGIGNVLIGIENVLIEYKMVNNYCRLSILHHIKIDILTCYSFFVYLYPLSPDKYGCNFFC
jgi:hypothetical protein